MLLLYQALHCTVYTAFLHLHSTMLLLYPSESNFNVTMLFWFTFHYASTLSCPTVPSTNCRNSIYIPLCFYFIHDLRHVIVQAISEFTFHYASTLSGHPRKITRAPTNLHSTMLLLYLLDCLHRKEGLHLHSTMLLLYCYPAFYLPSNHVIFSWIKKRHSINYSDRFSIRLLYAMPFVLS